MLKPSAMYVWYEIVIILLLFNVMFKQVLHIACQYLQGRGLFGNYFTLRYTLL